MSPMQCSSCGLVDHEKGKMRCYAFHRPITDKELEQDWPCHYYLPQILEDGELLTAYQHFLLKRDEIDRKK